MKKLGEILIRKEPFEEILMGNYALVRAMIESGVKVATSYPGSPTPEIADAIKSIPSEENPLYFEFSTNEKVALEVAFGASINGFFSCVFFKSVGLNVAADSFVQLSLMELTGGMVIVLGDDPGANSSQNEQDNFHYARLAYMPVFEPSTPKEAYEFFKISSEVSKERKMPVILRMSTHVCHAKEKVAFSKYEKSSVAAVPAFNPENGPYIPITSAVFPLKRRALKKLEDLREFSENTNINKVYDFGEKRFGIITSGIPFISLMDVFEEQGKNTDVLKLGMKYPLPSEKILEFLRSHKEIRVLEELDDELEKDIKALAFDHGIKTKITGKMKLEDWIGEYSSEKVAEILNDTWPDIFEKFDEKAKFEVSPRPAQLCPGCGHRSAFYAIKKAIGENDITVADIGCHTLGFLEPYKIGQVLLCMGHSNGTGSGLSLFNTDRKVITFLGDSTFFHAGIPGIINAQFHNHPITLIIMENGTTAMTGHQSHPGEKIPIRGVLEGLGIKNIRETDTYKQEELTDMVRNAINEDEFNVIIAKHPCMLKFTREAKRKGKKLPKPVRIGKTCSRLHICVSEFACPSYQIEENSEVWVQKDLCIGDGSCIQTCPTRSVERTDGKEGEE